MKTTLDNEGNTVYRFYTQNKEIACQINKGATTVVKGGIVPDGVVREYYADGAVKVEKTFKDNTAEGISRGFYPNGSIEFETHYKQGKLDGPAWEYYSSGVLASELNYKGGRLSGYWREYYENKQLKAEKFFQEGKWSWVANYYDEKGRLTETTSYDTEQDTVTIKREYYPGGVIKFQDYYKSGVKFRREAYDEYGKLLFNRNY